VDGPIHWEVQVVQAVAGDQVLVLANKDGPTPVQDHLLHTHMLVATMLKTWPTRDKPKQHQPSNNKLSNCHPTT
jgi:hypothetical protein